MAVSKCLVLLLSVLAAAAAQSVRVKKQVHLAGVYPYVVPGVVHGEDDGSYWPGKYPDDPVPVPAAPVAPVLPYPYAAPLPYAPAPFPYPAPAAYHHGEDDGSYYDGKYGPENQ